MPRDQDAINDHAHERLEAAWQRAYEQAEREIMARPVRVEYEGDRAYLLDDLTPGAIERAIQARAEELMDDA